MIAVLDYAGVFAFALSGAALAIRQRFDIVGTVALALVTGLFGGILRDLLLDAAPPVAFTQQRYLLVPVVAAAAAAIAPGLIDTLRRPVLVLDAAGLGLFAVVGATRAVDAGLGIGAATVVGALSATGGGIVRDVLAKRVPEIFTPDSRLYVIPASVGAAATAGSTRLLDDGVSAGAAGVAIAVAVFVVRMLSLRYGWSTRALRSGPEPSS